MIVDDFPISNDASLFARDFRGDLLAKFGTRYPYFVIATSSRLMSKKLGLFALRSRSLLAVGHYYKRCFCNFLL